MEQVTVGADCSIHSCSTGTYVYDHHVLVVIAAKIKFSCVSVRALAMVMDCMLGRAAVATSSCKTCNEESQMMVTAVCRWIQYEHGHLQERELEVTR